MDLWKNYEVKINFTGKLCGSVPLNSQLLQGWLDARKPSVRPPNSKDLSAIATEVMQTIATENLEEENKLITERVTLGFQNVNGLVMRGGTMKAHIKDCARIISSMVYGKVKGERSFAVRALNCVYVKEYWLPIIKNEKRVEEPDGFLDKAVHVQTAMGPRNALKRILFIEEPSMTFGLMITQMKDGKTTLSKSDLETIFTYGGVHGYAGERGDGEGRYTFQIEEK